MIASRLAGEGRGSAEESRTRRPSGQLLAVMWLLVGLAAVVWLRWALLVDGRLDGITVGAAFGLALTTLGVAASREGLRDRGDPAGDVRRHHVPVGRDLAIGLAGGGALVALALVARIGIVGPVGSVAPRPAADAIFWPWLAVTTVVAVAEELVLRGALFTMLERAPRRVGGPVVAVAVTSTAFALMHVPVYGWHVVPLDLGVGIFLGGLRLATGGWVAPAVAHVVADIATWWL